MDRVILGLLIVASIVFVGPQDATAQYGPDTCKQGFVWREAIPSDHVCVPPNIRTMVQQENAMAASRRDPTGAYGSDSCVQGYVWREAFQGDRVCVTPARRTETAQGKRSRRKPAAG